MPSEPHSPMQRFSARRQPLLTRPCASGTSQQGARTLHLSYFVSVSCKCAYPQHSFKQNCRQLIENKRWGSFLIATKMHLVNIP